MRPKKKILLVDADEQALSVRQYLFETRGYEVHACLDAAAAFAWVGRQVCASGAEPFSVMVCNLCLPPAGGNWLVRRVKAVRPSLPALLFSTQRTLDYGEAIAADAFLPKGFTNAELLERVRVLATRKRGPKKAVRVVLDGLGEGADPGVGVGA